MRDLLVELSKGDRDQGSNVDKKLAKDDAKKLHKVRAQLEMEIKYLSAIAASST